MKTKPLINAAQLYDLVYYANQPSDTQFINFLLRELLRYASGPSVLDCACGTGEPSLSLLGSFSMTFSDISPEMLAILHQKAKQRKIQEIPIICVRWSDLSQVMRKQFDVVICCGNSISQVPTTTELQKALSGMAGVIKEDGMIYLDFREDALSIQNRKFELKEVFGPLRWQGQDILVTISERKKGNQVERMKLCHQLSGTRLTTISRVLTRYTPIKRQVFLKELYKLGFSSVVFLRRPGRWRLTSIIARRAAICG